MEPKEFKRKEIAQAAKELFTEYGYKSVSMDLIAQKANVAKGTLYLYFKDKEALFYHLASEFIEESKAFVSDLETHHLRLLDEIHEVVYYLLMCRKNQKFLFKVSQEANELRTPSALTVMKMIDDMISGYLKTRLDRAMEEGMLKPCNTSVLTFVVLRVYTALAFEWEERNPPLDERQIAESVRAFLQNGLIIHE